MTTYVNENFDGVTPPALPSGFTAFGTAVTSSSQSRSGANSVQISASTAWAAIYKSGQSTNGGDCTISEYFRYPSSPTSFVGPTLWLRQFYTPSSQTFGYGYFASLFIESHFEGLQLYRDASNFVTFTPAGMAAAFTGGAWYQFRMDAITALDRRGAIFRFFVKRDSDGKYLVASTGTCAWVAAQHPTPFYTYFKAEADQPDNGYGMFGNYGTSGNDVYVDDCVFQDFDFSEIASYIGSNPSDEVEWILDGTTAWGTGTNLSQLYDDDLETPYNGFYSTATRAGCCGIDLGSGHSGILSRVLYAPRRGDASANPYDQYLYLATIEGSSSTSGDFAAVGCIPGQYYHGAQWNEVRIDHTPANAYRVFRVCAPGQLMAGELAFLGNRATGVAWRPARPTITPGAGRYDAGQSITMATLTSGASIYYTTDGSDPDNTDTHYTGAITLPLITSGTQYTIKAVAYHASGTETYSKITTAVFCPAEFVPSTGSTRFGTSNEWPQDWFDDTGKLIEAHYGGIFDDGTHYYWYGSPLGQGACELVAQGVIAYRSDDTLNWTPLGIVAPPFPASFRAGGAGSGGNIFNNVQRLHVIHNPSPINPAHAFLMFARAASGPTYTGSYYAVAGASSAAGPFTWLAYFQSTSTIADQFTFFDEATSTINLVFGALTGRQLSATTDYTSFDGAEFSLGTGPATEAPVVFEYNGGWFALQSDTTDYGANTDTGDKYKASDVSFLDLANHNGATGSIWASTPASIEVPYHAQPTAAFKLRNRDGLILMLDFGASGDANAGDSDVDLFHARHVLYPVAPTDFPAVYEIAVRSPNAWTLSELPLLPAAGQTPYNPFPGIAPAIMAR